MTENDYTEWLSHIDEDGDYGFIKYCGECREKSYKCNCKKESN